jgi:hypothetical protein
MGRLTLDRGKAEVLIRRVGTENLMEEGRRVMRYCQEESPVLTGELLASHRVVRVSWRAVRVIATAPYARRVFDGDGPNGRRRPNRWLTRGMDRARVG